ncbi:MAG: DNA cytosine methyltransferase [Planctomycetota bacterium]|nr:DNA cytosine methyltransferase [Planctomycetota bacterium]
MALRYISMFSGIECVSLGVHAAGVDWEPVCFAEIAPFPAAVLAHHYPGVPNVGDITAHDWRQYRGKVDLVAGGSPCQAFSTAGRRQSLSDDRGDLTLSFVEAINAIDPELVLWENVPGVLSVKNNAFGCFLGALAGADSPLVPPPGKRWTNAGVAVGPKRQIAWRILDARHFGVPQRRRRVFLVAGRAGGRTNPAEILFKSESLRRHP